MSLKVPIIKRFHFIPDLPEAEITKIHKSLDVDATFDSTYLVLTVSACLIASFGLISNSTGVIIGAMLVAPLMLPLRALAFGALKEDLPLLKKASFSIIGATIIALFLSWSLGSIVNIPVFGSEVISRTQPQIIDLGIAIAAGGLSGFGKIKDKVSDALAGTAIAVALMPPLCVVGLCLSQHLYSYSLGALLLYLTNLLGITFACMIVFILTGYLKFHRSLIWNIGLLSLLLIPLGGSFLRMVRQEQLQAEITNQLAVSQTINLDRDEIALMQVKVIWNQNPTLVYVIVHTDKDITPQEVQSIENHLIKKIKQPLKLVFTVNRIEHITANEDDLDLNNNNIYEDKLYLDMQRLLEKKNQEKN